MTEEKKTNQEENTEGTIEKMMQMKPFDVILTATGIHGVLKKRELLTEKGVLIFGVEIRSVPQHDGRPCFTW